MKRTTVSLPDDLAWHLERAALRERVSASEIVRRALADHLNVAPGRPRRIPFAALGNSGYSDTSERFDEILAEKWADHIANDRDP